MKDSFLNRTLKGTKIFYYVYDTVDKLKAINEFIFSYKKLVKLMKYEEDEEVNHNELMKKRGEYYSLVNV